LLALKTGLGGETFIPKLPACTVDVLARAIAPDAKHKILGIRPGEKIHEALMTVDEAQNVLEYDSHYVIRPNFPWWGGPAREGGKPTPAGFMYSSENVVHLGVDDVRSLLVDAGFMS
jgi:UDP-N-acetylglucosamine 4,6-dehydratase